MRDRRVVEGSYDEKEITLLLVVAPPEERGRIERWLSAERVPDPFRQAPGIVLDEVVVQFVPCQEVEIVEPRGARRDVDAGEYCVPTRLVVSWEPKKCPATLQAYQGGDAPMFQGKRGMPDVSLTLTAGITELKLWATEKSFTSRWVRVSDSCPQ